jgi:hypothetical protein
MSYSRWSLLLEKTTASGKMLFQCGVCGRVTPTPDKQCKGQNCAEVERLQRIEAAARAHIADWDGGDTSAHKSRDVLRKALEER